MRNAISVSQWGEGMALTGNTETPGNPLLGLNVLPGPQPALLGPEEMAGHPEFLPRPSVCRRNFSMHREGFSRGSAPGPFLPLTRLKGCLICSIALCRRSWGREVTGGHQKT